MVERMRFLLILNLRGEAYFLVFLAMSVSVSFNACLLVNDGCNFMRSSVRRIPRRSFCRSGSNLICVALADSALSYLY